MPRTGFLESGSPDVLDAWARLLRDAVITDLANDQTAVLARAAASAAGSGLATAAVVTGLGAGAAQGGAAMTAIATTATSHTVAKLVAAGAVVTLAAGGAAAVNGSLPEGLQAWVAEAAARVGIELPHPAFEAGIRQEIRQDIEVGSAGTVEVRLREGALVVGDLQANSGWTASIRSESSERAVVEFSSEGESVSLEIMVIEGQIETALTSETESSTEVEGGSAPSEPSEEADGASGEVGLDVEGELDLGIDLGG